MNVVTLSSGATLSISPLFDKGVAFNKFELVEFSGGSLPQIILSIRTTKDVCQLGDIIKFKIVNEAGWCNEFEAYVYDLNYLNTNLVIKLTSCNPEFVRNHYTDTYIGIDEAISATYKYMVNYNAHSDLVNDLNIYQMNETNYKFLTNLMNGFRKDVVWGYAAGILMIRDVREWTSEYQFNIKEGTSITDGQSISDPSRMELEVEILEEFTNFTKIKFGKDIVDVSNDYLDLIQNRVHNQKYANSRSSYVFETKYIPPIVVCSNVGVVNSDTSVDNCYVTMRKIEIADTDLQCKYEIKSINP